MGHTLFVYLFSLVTAALPIHHSKPAMAQDWQKLVPHFVEVTNGETLGSLATVLYGNPNYWKVLWNDNAWLENPNIIYSHSKLRIRQSQPGRQDLALSLELSQRIAAFSRPKIIPQIASATVDLVNLPDQGKPEGDDQVHGDFDELYKKAGEKYDVPWQILYGIHLTETGLRGSSSITNHSGSGATGPMQFMPGTWNAYGQDCNGDGVADITNVDDAICGAANFMQKHGSIASGLRSYGGNTKVTLSAAIARGYNPSEKP